MALYAHFRRQLQSLAAPAPASLVIAYSGGLDSQVLLHLCHRYRLEFPDTHLLGVHVHHGLNPAADAWLSHCQSSADSWQVSLAVERVTIRPRPRHSLEALAREARYEALSRHLESQGVLLTAHHNDDQMETLLLQLKRGAGPRGLGAMATCCRFGAGWLVRPLLELSRQQLWDYAQAHELNWVEDDSNQDLRFDRNFLRHRVLPLLRQRWPGIGLAMQRSAELCAEQDGLLEEIAEQDLRLCGAVDEHHGTVIESLALAPLQQLSPARQANLLRYWLRCRQLPVPSRVQLAEVQQQLLSARADANPRVAWLGIELRRYQGQLYALRSELPLETPPIPWNGEPCLPLPGGLPALRFMKVKGQGVRLSLEGEGVTIRFRGGAIRCRPAGRAGSRSLKKLFQEYQVPPWERGRIPLVFVGEQLVMAVGLWICHGWQAENGESGWIIRFDDAAFADTGRDQPVDTDRSISR